MPSQRFHALPPRKLVAGLDLARRRDHSAFVLLDAEPDRLTVSAALRLPQVPLRQQFALIAPHLAGLDLLVFDQSGLGDAAATRRRFSGNEPG
jgi:phage FluMu gp28-like protein